MYQIQPKPVSEENENQFALWTAGIFSALSLAILLFELFAILVTQKGIIYPGDWVFTPLSAFLVGVGLFSYIQIRRGHYNLGVWLLFVVMVQIPAITVVLVLRDFSVVAGLFLLLTSSALIWLGFPTSSRGQAVIVLTFSAVVMIGLELWNPPFRVRIGDASGIIIAILVIGGLALTAVMVRQAIFGNILARLIVLIAVLVVGGVGLSNWLNLRAYQASLTEQIGGNLSNRSNFNSVLLTSTLDHELSTLKTLALNPEIQQAAAEANKTYITHIDVLDKQWIAADAANNNNDPLVAGVLNNPTSEILRNYKSQFVENVEVFLTGGQGFNVAASNRTSDYLQADEEWWNSAYRDGLYVSQPEYDTSSKATAIIMAVVVRQNGTGPILGVLRTTVNFSFLADTLTSSQFEKTGRSIILLPNGKEFRLIDTGGGKYEITQDDAPSDLVKISESTLPYQAAIIQGVPVVVSFSGLKTIGMATTDLQSVVALNWDIATIQDQSEAFQAITVQSGNTVALGFTIIFLGIILAIFIARLISDPITRLTIVARKVANGDLSATVNVESQDEVGVLANTFNIMVNQLRDLIGTLEVRVAERTRALNASTEVTRRLATILNPAQLALEVVEQVQSAFNYYHTHIYFIDEATGDLIMAGGTGEAGAAMLARHHKVARGRGLVGRAAQTNKSVLVPDVFREPSWLPNALLPDTRSEAAIPISSGSQVLGVLDVQQNKTNGLSEEDVQVLQSLAGQVAISLQNARSFEQTRAQAELDSMVNTIGQKIQRAGSVEEVLQVAVRELGLAVGAARVSAGIEVQPDGSNNNASKN